MYSRGAERGFSELSLRSVYWSVANIKVSISIAGEEIEYLSGDIFSGTQRKYPGRGIMIYASSKARSKYTSLNIVCDER